VIKSLIILVLLLALAVVSFMTRPSQTDFQNYIRQHQASGNQVSVKGLWNDYEVESYLKSATFHDRLLWVTVEKDGQPQYTGAFNHWFRSSTASTPAPASK
jgi:hypothetical protein